ncbi:MAG: glutamine--tRNA ligase/YqeY domain fusion protein [Rhodothermales bacterium]|nr:glutamine--tRNA ligase/YqeY domain fusion protein [Rhodothermales bacterium]MBO6778953.1 glutamine--tRNA ligase/YqeY domain fusion protein [Rhodothermales bacterium]
MASESSNDRSGGLNFLEQIVERDLDSGAVQHVVTRFPPEPNGYPHIGHAKAICINFGIANDYKGRCHLRFDDTNPETEDMEYVRAMERDVRWLGFDWGDYQFYASDYFDQLYEHARTLIRKGLAYVDSQSDTEIRENRGTVTEPGVDSRFRDRSVEENLDLFARMRAGEFPDGTHVLRARIDMASNNMLLRDPVLYRIKHAEHYRTGNDWPIYPLYDFAHPLSDAIEGISHSLCSLEFEVHRPLYDWLVDALYDEPRPHQYEFARLNLDYTVMSKRKLLRLVQEQLVDGWDDPRMPTLSGMRRRGITPEAIRRFCDLIGVAKADNRVDISLLEYAIRDDLNHKAPRVMAVLEPLKVTITNWEGDLEWIDASHWPHDVPREGSRPVPFGRELYIDRKDFRLDPPPKFHRLAPGQEVRLRYAYVIRCDEVVTDDEGNVVELRCTYDPETRSGGSGGRRVKGTIHWVEASHAVPAELRLYDRLFRSPDPEDVPEGQDFLDNLNPDSLQVSHGYVEHALRNVSPGERFQFERQGYFIREDTEAVVFNRTITLRDTWAKLTTEPEPQRPKPRKERQHVVQEGPAVPTLSPEQEATATALVASHGLDPDDGAILASDPWLLELFEATAERGDGRTAANWVLHEVQRVRKASRKELVLTAPALSTLIRLVADDVISIRTAKELLDEVAVSGDDPAVLVESRGLAQIADSGALEQAARKVVEANPGKAEAYRAGKKGLIGFFMGQLMRETGGKANPEMARKSLLALLD